MKQIRYISRFADALTSEEITKIAESSARHNREVGVTGMLIASGELFFQIIEGADDKVDALYEAILRDERHNNVLTLSTEQGPEVRRLYPDWSMKKFDLSLEVSDRAELAKSHLNTVFQLHSVLADLIETLEQFTWRAFVAAEMRDLEKK